MKCPKCKSEKTYLILNKETKEVSVKCSECKHVWKPYVLKKGNH